MDTPNETPTYTPEDFAEFKKLVEMGESRRQMDRIESRLNFKPFIEKHGKAKCDLMFADLCKEDKKP